MDDEMFVIANVLPGKLNAMVKNVMRQTGTDDPVEAVRLVNSGEWVITPKKQRWTVRADGIIILDALPATTGITGQQYIDDPTFNKTKWAKDIMKSKDFWVTAGTIYTLAIIPGSVLSDDQRMLENVRAKADRCGLLHGKAISPEISCLFRKYYSNQEIKQMGLAWLVAMHESIMDSDGDPLLLGTDRHDSSPLLDTDCDHPVGLWDRGDGFVCVSSQESQSSDL